jgi:hypothetical protein
VELGCRIEQFRRNTSTPHTNRTNDTKAITKLRDEIALQMDGEFVECPVGTFVAHYLPFEPAESDLNAFIANATHAEQPPAAPSSLMPLDGARMTRTSSQGRTPSVIPPRSHHILEFVEGELRFIDYHAVPTTSGENKTYSYLERIMRVISEATVDGRPQNGYHYHACPNATVTSEIPGANKIDGCIVSDLFVTANGQVDVKATGIAVAFEYKLESGPNSNLERVTEVRFDPASPLPRFAENHPQNNKQVVSANVQIMNDDVRRMFSYRVSGNTGKNERAS